MYSMARWVRGEILLNIRFGVVEFYIRVIDGIRGDIYC